MFKRFIRAIKSLFGGAIGAMEDPKLILEQNIRELNDQVPKMNENIATVKANLVMLKKEKNRYDKNIQELTAKIESAINSERDDIAENYAIQLQRAEEHAEQTEEQIKHAEQAYQKALQVKKAFMREKDRKIQEARDALRASERAEWQGKIADTLEKFEVAGLEATHDEMISKVNEDAAKNEARMEMALDSVDTKTLEIEQDAEKMRASELVKQFKQRMKAGSADSSSEKSDQKAGKAGKTGKDKEQEQPAKTMGRGKTKN